MKINTKKSGGKSSPFYKRNNDDDADASSTGSWMSTDPSEIQQRAAAVSAATGKRAPEFYIKEGDEEDKKLRILKRNPIAMFRRYSLKYNGRYDSFTAPPPEEDLFLEAGLKSSPRYVFKVLDYAGYTDKKGNVQRNLVRYWVVGQRVYQQLMKIAEKSGPLTKYDITVSRTGSGTSTAYQILPEPPSDLSPKAQAAVDKAPRLEDESELKKFYAPLSAKEQIGILKAAHLR